MTDHIDLIALQAGADAFAAGKPLAACPYSPRQEHRQMTLWVRGYNNARATTRKPPPPE